MSITIKSNGDNGSLKVGTSAGTHQWKVGDQLRILGGVDENPEQGESKVRKVTFIMGAGEKCHLCFKGQGPLPKGEVTYELVD